ncbi:MAG: twin-arginine translocase TatA/TatE family subunit [Gammaproteobacteria bacterium]|nr:twin-arginine translocase TatA/TatE family subunit [Gammaproteobacteria bacterium]MYF12343.1 twin-arginine translocase TatA/TatE family subunit [Gammaproteobacteria bacterium]MYF52029.1 twin-arginine translocase TatA/TatE family subunit [Gammaproteobacteria bacterium]MYG14082.1 twin-arginine translocase TatA/TatE family subunit [Gammaproteobacteria bacterium]MYH14424.1 twin-arginine translocase TatA/TatE family subunit [Gammaproteobacteria bacterium]
MFGGFGVTELLIVLAIVLLIFGPKRLKNIGSDLGNAIKGFRKAVTDEEAEAAAAAKAGAQAQNDPNVIEGEVASQASQKEDSHQQSTNQQNRV